MADEQGFPLPNPKGGPNPVSKKMSRQGRIRGVFFLGKRVPGPPFLGKGLREKPCLMLPTAIRNPRTEKIPDTAWNHAFQITGAQNLFQTKYWVFNQYAYIGSWNEYCPAWLSKMSLLTRAAFEREMEVVEVIR